MNSRPTEADLLRQIADLLDELAEARGSRIWPLIKLNTLTVQRVARHGFTSENPFKETDEEAVIEACRKVSPTPTPEVEDE